MATKVAEVIAEMTQAEKLGMVHGIGVGIAPTPPSYSGETLGVPRLCVPPLHISDGPAGVSGVTGATELPAPVAVAAAWDPALSRAYGTVIGSEMHTYGSSVAMAPTINIVRDPRWGRIFESLGEDPYLTSQLAVPEIEGIQSQGVIAVVKHFAVYNQETYRDSAADNAIVDERALQELYLPAFEAAVDDAHVGAVMCAYSTINGTPACADKQLLDATLKQEWGFSGFVMTDWSADFGTPDAAMDGLDLQMPDGCFFGTALTKALETGAVTTARLNDMVGRILTSMFEAGVIDRPPTGHPTATATTPAHKTLARTAAEEGTVLLRNKGVLPITPSKVHTLAVIGAEASTEFASFAYGSATVLSKDVITPLQGLKKRAGTSVRIVYDDGSDPERATKLAASADEAVVFVGRLDGELHDHTTLNVEASQNKLVDAVSKQQPKTVVVLNNGSPLVMPWLDHVGGVVENWFSGEGGGSAIAAVLFGDVDPSGKLPTTFPASLADVPAAKPSQWPGTGGKVHFDEGLLVGYKWDAAHHVTPLFPFGFGLSYTTFSFGHLTAPAATDDGRITVTATVTNTGDRAGAEVAQLYLAEPAEAGEPPLQLRGFERVQLQPGESKVVRFELAASALMHWDPATRQWTAPIGDYTLMVGSSSSDLPLAAELQLTRVLRGATTPAVVPNVATTSKAAATKLCPIDAFGPNGNAKASTPIP